MTPDQWNRVKELYSKALDLPDDQRLAFVVTASGDDAELREELLSLLENAALAGEFLENPTEEIPAAALAATPYPQSGDRLGIYAIVQQIGEGGMGVVYQAIRDDDAFRKLVAIKILKRGMDTDYILQRFENEKQILAHFDHPNIARVLDAGITPDHRPFFVMEFYSGLPLDRFCRERRPTLEARIRLFQKICAAVDYAHQNLIVHRDLKPGNILILGDGEPRLLDFGIAKVLSDERQMTGIGVHVMTPGYASPEQIRGEPVNTAADIYSLGVLLYEVLTGQHPFPRRTREPFSPTGLDLDRDPKLPSTLIRTQDGSGDHFPEGIDSLRQWSHMLRGDLDRIVLKALASDPARRYHTVDQLSADLEHYLAGRPVTAAADSVGYRVTKFARRNWLAVSSGVIVVVALTAALAIARYETAIARREWARAEHHAAELRRLAQSLVFDVHDVIENLPGATPVREKMLSHATQALDNLRANARDDPAAQVELADVYRRLGAVHGLPSESNLGRAQEALADYRKAAELLEHIPVSKRNADVLFRQAQVYDQMARVMVVLGQGNEAAQFFRKSIQAREQMRAFNPPSLDARRSLAAERFTAARLEINAGRLPQALDLARQSLAEYESALQADPDDAATRFALALNAKTLAAIYTQLREFGPAKRHASRALEIDRARLKARPGDGNIPLDVSFDLSELAEAEIGSRDFAAALVHYQEALQIREGLLRQDPQNARLRDRTAYINGKFGLLLMDTGRVADAERHIRRQFDILRALAAETPNVSIQARLAEARGDLGAWSCKMGERAHGRNLLLSSIAEIKDLQIRQKLTFADTLPLDRFEQAAAACETLSSK